MTTQSDILFEHIRDAISEAHNPALVIPTESPNGNIIYHLYSDGEITSQKGGWAYLRRSEFTDSYGRFKKNYVELFPMKTKNYRNQEIAYAIVTKQDATKITIMIKEYEQTL